MTYFFAKFVTPATPGITGSRRIRTTTVSALDIRGALAAADAVRKPGEELHEVIEARKAFTRTHLIKG